MKDLSNKYIVYGIHGGTGGGRRAGATANALQDMSQRLPNADLYVHSHTHTTVNYNDMIFLYDYKTKKVKEHKRMYFNANAFLKYGGYAEQKEYKPVDRTPSVLVVKAIRSKGEMKIKTDVVRI
jgi:hypothetical protein